MTTDPKKTLVLVIGAGASKEAGLPVGNELKGRIAAALDIRFGDAQQLGGDRTVTEALQTLVHRQSAGLSTNINPHLLACRRIRDAMPQAASIDNFLDAHRHDVRISEAGKLAIARCIIDAEVRSKLFVDQEGGPDQLDFEALEATWYNTFFRILVEGCQLPDLANRLSQVTIVTFNYDRCIEHYLHGAIRNYYGLDSEQAASLLMHLRVLHAYGSVGTLPSARTYSELGVPFGAAPNRHQLVDIASGLKTFSEGTDLDHSNTLAIRASLKAAKQVAFAGCAFNRQNIELLFGAHGAPPDTHPVPVIGTAYGLSNSDVRIIHADLSSRTGRASHWFDLRQDLTCQRFFVEYGRALALT